jgi:DNA adenine methylase
MHKHPQQQPRSPLKYAGSKKRLLPVLLPHLPSGARLIEPFVGAGNVFLATDYPAAILNDANRDLMTVWVAVKERPREFVSRASEFFCEANCCAEAYAQVRDEYNKLVDSYERAVRLPYLNRFGFNGLYRVNRNGKFNTPYARPKKLPKFPFDEFAYAAERLETAALLSGSFAAAMEHAGPGDVVYCDPPYLDQANGRKSFTEYTAEGFGLKEQVELVQAANAAVVRGATVLISNHDTAQARQLYDGFEHVQLVVKRSLAADAEKRVDVAELLAIKRPA